MTNQSLLPDSLRNNSVEILRLTSLKPDWKLASDRLDRFWSHLSNPNDPVWSASTIEMLTAVYFSQRDKDKGMSNITVRTLAGMPDHLKNAVRIIFLQIAEACTFFNSTHKVNFEPEELPLEFTEIQMVPSKNKGMLTFGKPLPGLYPKTSLTFDYWVPKILEWTGEVRQKGLSGWKGTEILKHESCTDFMRISLMFLSDPLRNPPVAKSEDREALLNLLGEEFIWIKKSAKREDIVANSSRIASGLQEVCVLSGMDIPLEAWNRILSTLKILK